MIQITCPNCQATFKTDDKYAGRSGKCPKCGGRVVVPGNAQVPQPVAAAAAAHVHASQVAAPAVAQAFTQPAPPQPTTVVVQIQQPAASGGTIGPANKSIAVVIILWLFVPITGITHFYIGQTGKGAVLLCLDFFLFGPLVILTCGIGLIVWIPFHLLVLIDAIIVASRIQRSAINPWRCF